MTKTKLIKAVAATLIVISISYFFIGRLQTSWSSLQEKVTLSPSLWGVFALLLFITAVASSGVLWGQILNRLQEKKIEWVEAIRVHTGAWLLKYIPGQAGSIVYKVAWGKKKGVNRTDVAWSFVYENIFLTIASTLVPALLLLGTASLPLLINILLIIGIIIGALGLLKQEYLAIFIKRISAKLEIRTDFKSFTAVDFLRFSVNYHIPRILNGLGFVFVYASLYGLDAAFILPLLAAYTLAGIVGIYAIFVPSGLGVREAMIVLFLSGIMSVDQAILLSVVARFYATIADGILALAYGGLTLNNHQRRTL